MTIRRGGSIIAGCASFSVNPDNKSITTNSSDQIQSIGIINQNATTTAIKTWTGTKAQYDAVSIKDNNTLYNVEELGLFKGVQAIASNASGRNIGEIVSSTIPLSDAGLHLLDGALIQGNGIYADFVTYIAGLVNTYSNIFTTESDWQSSVSSYGVCGKFVYDSTNNTIRLPKITGFVEGTTDLTALGDLIQAGLPNITGTFDIINHNPEHNHTYTGAFKKATVDSMPVTGISIGESWKEGWGIVTEYLDSSGSNSIYGNSSTVQPQSIKLLYYIVIATTTKTDIEVDIDEIANDLNGKADTSLANVTTSGKHIALDWGFPSTRAVQLTIGANNTSYTAPANGWFTLTANEAKMVRFDGVPLKVTLRDSTSLSAGFVPVRKGETIILNYDTLVASYEWTGFWFVYAQGEE